MPVQGAAWPGGFDGVLLLGDSLPSAEQLTALAQSPHRVFLVSLRRPPAPAAAGPTPSTPVPQQPPSTPSAPVPIPTPRLLTLPLQGARLLVRKAYVFCSPAAVSVPLTGDPSTAESDHPMPDAPSATTPGWTGARDLSAATADAVLLALELEERWAADWDATAQGGPRALLKMLAALMPPPHRPLDVFALATRGELLGQRTLRATARIPAAAVLDVLRLSGTGGLIIRPFRVDGPSPHSVVWVPGALPDALQAAASLPGACGLVANARGLGIRVLAADYAGAYAALRQAPPPAPKLFYELAGAPLDLTAEPLAAALRAEGWTATPLRSFVRSGRRCWVLQAEAAPEFSLLRTAAGLATLQPARDRPPRRSQPWTKVTVGAPPPPAPKAVPQAAAAAARQPPPSAWRNGPPQHPQASSTKAPSSASPSEGASLLPAANLPQATHAATPPELLQEVLQRLTALERASPSAAPTELPLGTLQRLTALEQQLARVPEQIAAATAPIMAMLQVIAARMEPSTTPAVSQTPPRPAPAAQDDDEDMADVATRKRGAPLGSPGAGGGGGGGGSRRKPGAGAGRGGGGK